MDVNSLTSGQVISPNLTVITGTSLFLRYHLYNSLGQIADFG
jgi:hypothetical protein